MSALLDRFGEEAPFPLKEEFAFACADRAVRRYAVQALRTAGLEATAKILSQLAPVTDKETAKAAVKAANVACVTAHAFAVGGDAANAPTAARAKAASANAADAADRAASFTHDVAYVFAASDSSADAADYAYKGDWTVERKAQDAWIRAHWEGASPITKATLTDLDAYIADGFLLGDDE